MREFFSGWDEMEHGLKIVEKKTTTTNGNPYKYKRNDEIYLR